MRDDFTTAELRAFYQQHERDRKATTCELQMPPKQVKAREDLRRALPWDCSSWPIKGIILGTRLRWPRSRDENETVIWYVGGSNGRVYACTREFSTTQPFKKHDSILLSGPSDEGTIVGDPESNNRVGAFIRELAASDFAD
ncbi:MAG: hypothetical protein ABSE56_08360 [Bryobacteraceae bacterium]